MPSSSGTSVARRHGNRSAQRHRRRGGNDPYLAGYAPLRGKGSCSGRQPTQEPAHHRSRRAKERVAGALHSEAGREGLGDSAGRESLGRGGGDQTRAALGSEPPPTALRRDLRTGRATGSSGG